MMTDDALRDIADDRLVDSERSGDEGRCDACYCLVPALDLQHRNDGSFCSRCRTLEPL